MRPSIMPRHLSLALALALCLVAGCRNPGDDPRRLPTGAVLDPAGPSLPLGSMPMAMAFSPDGSRIAVVLSGWREQGIQIVDPVANKVVRTLKQPAAFVGAAFAPDGRRLYASGGSRDLVYVYDWRDGDAALADSIPLARPGAEAGRSYPAGLAISPDGSRLYVAENLADSLAVVDLAARRVVQRLATGRYPYGIAVAPDGRVYVSAWGERWVAAFSPDGGALAPGPRIEVGRHPSTLLLDPAGSRLFVTCAASDRIAVVDTRRGELVAALADSAPGAPAEGSTPNGLALSPDGRRLYVAEADANAVAIFGLSAATSGVTGAKSGASADRADALLGRVPVEWYPTAVLARGGSLWVLNGKGHGTGPNPARGHPGARDHTPPTQYTLGQTTGSLTRLEAPADRELPKLSARVAVANGWDRPKPTAALPPFKHVIYVIRENRTYDQVFGDLAGADGDPTLTYFPRAVTPNAHALAERFGVYDRFFVNAEVSGQGHNWTVGAYTTDYVEKTVPSQYSGRGRSYDFDGQNRGETVDDDVAEGSRGYLWDLARQAGVSLRNYGEFTYPSPDGKWVATKPWLRGRTDPLYPGWDLSIPDTLRSARWLAEFRGQCEGDSLPALTILWLPNDHTSGGAAGAPTPKAYVAQNDLALGQIVEAVTRSRYWSSTVMFVLEDDAQDGPDHFDSHRSPLLVISPYNRRGVEHRWANTTDVLATIDRILNLGALSQFDHFGEPLTDVFTTTADTAPYATLRPRVPLGETNPAGTAAAEMSKRLDFAREDAADEDLFNQVLWLTVMGPNRPYPARAAMPRPD